MLICSHKTGVQTRVWLILSNCAKLASHHTCHTTQLQNLERFISCSPAIILLGNIDCIPICFCGGMNDSSTNDMTRSGTQGYEQCEGSRRNVLMFSWSNIIQVLKTLFCTLLSTISLRVRLIFEQDICKLSSESVQKLTISLNLSWLPSFDGTIR